MISEALSGIYVFSHMMLPLLVVVYLVEDYNSFFEWAICLWVLFVFLILLYCMCISDLASIILLKNSSGMYRIKILLFGSYVYGGILSYFFPKQFPDSYTREILRRMPKYRKAFLYGIVGNAIIYGWWGRGLMEVAIWLTIITMIILSICIIRRQIQIIMLERAGQNKYKPNKKKHLMINCVLRTVISSISLFGFTSCGLARAYLLFTIK